MYDRFYGFTERPFSLLPDPDFLYLGEKHRAALDTLELAIFNHSGFCVISGEIGAGKTTLIRELLNRLDDDIQVGLVSNTHPSFGELMQWIIAACGLPGGNEDRLDLHKHFVDFVIQRYAEGKHTLLIIDEAQNLSMAALEELRMLSNVNSEKDMVLQIILVGQSELRDKLRKPELSQFAQRISIDYYLGGLTPDETALYIRHRVTHAGGAADLFSPDACRQVFEFSKGIPRVINRLCDLSLVYGFAENREQISADVVLAVAREQHMGEAMEAARMRADEPPAAALPGSNAGYEDDKAPEPEPVDVRKPDPQPVKAPEPETPPEPDNVPAELQAETADSTTTPSESTRRSKAETRQHDLHSLVVNAEKTARVRGERSALWLFLGVAVMVGAAGWMSRDAWLPTLEVAARSEPEVADKPDASDAEIQAAREKAQHEEEARLAKQRAAEEARLEQAKREKAEREKAASLAKQRAAEQAKLEQAERDKAAREQAAKLAKQRAEQQAAEKAKLEQAKREKASREKAARLAKQQAAEKAKREQAKREQARREKAARIAKQQAAEKARHEELLRLAKQKEQARREQAARALSPEKVDLEEQARRERAARAMLGSTPDWSEDDEEEPVDEARAGIPAEEPATVSPPVEATTAVVTAPASNKDGTDAAPADATPEDVTSDADGFSSNPCDGPTARFLSTCR